VIFASPQQDSSSANIPSSSRVKLTARARVRPIRSVINNYEEVAPSIAIAPQPSNLNLATKTVKASDIRRGRKGSKTSPSRLQCKTCNKNFVCPQSKR